MFPFMQMNLLGPQLAESGRLLNGSDTANEAEPPDELVMEFTNVGFTALGAFKEWSDTSVGNAQLMQLRTLVHGWPLVQLTSKPGTKPTIEEGRAWLSAKMAIDFTIWCEWMGRLWVGGVGPEARKAREELRAAYGPKGEKLRAYVDKYDFRKCGVAIKQCCRAGNAVWANRLTWP